MCKIYHSKEIQHWMVFFSALAWYSSVNPTHAPTPTGHENRAHGMSELQEINHGVSFMLGGLAGIVGASCVFPLDSIKTRLQNQRGGSARVYKGVMDCARQVVAREGVRGLYRGLLVQWVGIAPEKAIKLGVNSALRRFFRDRNYAKGVQDPGDTVRTFRLHPVQEMVAGGLAGLAHVGVTSPYEMVKIRLQLSAESGYVCCVCRLEWEGGGLIVVLRFVIVDVVVVVGVVIVFGGGVALALMSCVGVRVADAKREDSRTRRS
jgi:Mitochondrial carrier protein